MFSMVPHFHKKTAFSLLSFFFFPRGKENKDFQSKEVSNKTIENNTFKGFWHSHNIKDIRQYITLFSEN